VAVVVAVGQDLLDIDTQLADFLVYLHLSSFLSQHHPFYGLEEMCQPVAMSMTLGPSNVFRVYKAFTWPWVIAVWIERWRSASEDG